MSDILDPARNAERRQAVLDKARRSMGVQPDNANRLQAVRNRLAMHPDGLVPARGQLERGDRITLFQTMAEAVSATVARVPSYDDIPREIASYLRETNLPQRLRHGDDPRLADLDWSSQRTMEVTRGIAENATEVGLSHAFGGVAESGTLVLTSGQDNPTTLNFLPENHIVVLQGDHVAGDYETVLERIRERYGNGEMPRTVNMITGPSRSGDIEQKLLLGAHGPRRLHIIIVE